MPQATQPMSCTILYQPLTPMMVRVSPCALSPCGHSLPQPTTTIKQCNATATTTSGMTSVYAPTSCYMVQTQPGYPSIFMHQCLLKKLAQLMASTATLMLNGTAAGMYTYGWACQLTQRLNGMLACWQTMVHAMVHRHNKPQHTELPHRLPAL